MFPETLPTLQHWENNLWQPAPRITPTEKQWSHIQQSREPMLCSLLRSLKRALLTYFTTTPVTLISCLFRVWAEALQAHHTPNFLVLVTSFSCAGLQQKDQHCSVTSVWRQRAAEQRKKRWRFCLHSGREEFLKALSKQRKWAWLLGTIHKYESQMLTSGVPYESQH